MFKSLPDFVVSDKGYWIDPRGTIHPLSNDTYHSQLLSKLEPQAFPPNARKMTIFDLEPIAETLSKELNYIRVSTRYDDLCIDIFDGGEYSASQVESVRKIIVAHGFMNRVLNLPNRSVLGRSLVQMLRNTVL